MTFRDLPIKIQFVNFQPMRRRYVTRDVRRTPVRLYFEYGPWRNRFGRLCNQGFPCWPRSCVGRWVCPGYCTIPLHTLSSFFHFTDFCRYFTIGLFSSYLSSLAFFSPFSSIILRYKSCDGPCLSSVTSSWHCAIHYFLYCLIDLSIQMVV